MSHILGIEASKLQNPNKSVLEEIFGEPVQGFPGTGDLVKVFKTPYTTSQVQSLPLTPTGDCFHWLDQLLIVQALQVPYYFQSGFAYDRLNIGQALYKPWQSYTGPRSLPSFSGDMQWEQGGQLVGCGTTNNEDWRDGFDTILRPGPFKDVPVWNYRLSGTNDYGNEYNGLKSGVSTALNMYQLRRAVPAIKAFLSESTLDRLYVWLKATKDPQEKHVQALIDGIFERIGITPAKSLKTNYYHLYRVEIDQILDALPTDYWSEVDPRIGQKIFVQLRDWGFRELDWLLSKGTISFAFFTGDHIGDAMLDMSEGFVTAKAEAFAVALGSSVKEAEQKVIQQYGTIPKFGNIGYLIDGNGRKAANPIDGIDDVNHPKQLSGIDTPHTPLAIAKTMLDPFQQPHAGSSSVVIEWVDQTLQSASGFNGTWNEWRQFLGTLPKFPA
jgi:hypothetical protein